MQCNGIFSPVMKYMETMKCNLVFQNVIMHEIHTYSVIDERKIDPITPGREKIHLGPKPPPQLCTLTFFGNSDR